MPNPGPASDRAFFTAAAVWCASLTIIAFAPGLYLRTDAEPIAAPVVFHGIVYAGWVLLFLTQSSLVSFRKLRAHRALGAAGGLLLLAMIPAGLAPVLYKLAIGTKSVDEAGFNITTLALGWAFAVAGLLARKSPAAHKRLMLLATVVLTVAAADRASAWLGIDDARLLRKLLAVVPAVALVAYDALRARRTPRLAVTLLALVWLDIYFVPSDWLFETPQGARLLETLAAAVFPAL